MSFAPRRIDHAVLASRNLSGQVELYRRLGFQVGARNRHPWGTENHIVQFDGSFIELISTGQGFRRPADGPPTRLSFPVFVYDYLQRREGFAMLALASQDAPHDREVFAKAGIGDFETFHFARRARRPDGSEAEVAFTLAFARSKLLPGSGFFVCEQHHPGNFWNPAFQEHPNGAIGLESVIMIAENPADHAEFLSHLTGQREMRSTSLGLEISLADGQALEVLTPQAYAFRYGDITPLIETTGLAALRIRVRDLDHARRTMLNEGIAALDRDGMLVVPPEIGDGTSIVFTSAGAPAA
jgi:hypothetical protein